MWELEAEGSLEISKNWPSLLFHARFKWSHQENRFFLVFGLIIHFMATTTKDKRCIFISRTPKCPGYRSILNKSRRYRLFSALLRSQFGPIWMSSPGCLKQQCPGVMAVVYWLVSIKYSICLLVGHGHRAPTTHSNSQTGCCLCFKNWSLKCCLPIFNLTHEHFKKIVFSEAFQKEDFKILFGIQCWIIFRELRQSHFKYLQIHFHILETTLKNLNIKIYFQMV